MRIDLDGNYWGNMFHNDPPVQAERGEWICLEFMVRMNDPADAFNGEQAFWINGQLRGHWRGLNWRTSPTLMANAFTLESYVTDRWTKNQTNIVYFDNVVIATEYIGPSGKR